VHCGEGRNGASHSDFAGEFSAAGVRRKSSCTRHVDSMSMLQLAALEDAMSGSALAVDG
jgi:hypothetical protein